MLAVYRHLRQGRSRADPFRKTNGGGHVQPGGLVSAMRRARFTLRRNLPMGSRVKASAITYDGIEYEASLSNDRKWTTSHRI